MMYFFFFFFKQKTAYEMRISDWSSDVCSSDLMDSPADATPTPPIKRHAVVTRLWHWINAIAVFILIGSGLGISNAHPRLYWGEYGANFDHAWLTLPCWPGWLTIPGHYNLALSRRWHLFFALVLDRKSTRLNSSH